MSPCSSLVRTYTIGTYGLDVVTGVIRCVAKVAAAAAPLSRTRKTGAQAAKLAKSFGTSRRSAARPVFAYDSMMESEEVKFVVA